MLLGFTRPSFAQFRYKLERAGDVNVLKYHISDADPYLFEGCTYQGSRNNIIESVLVSLPGDQPSHSCADRT